MRHALFLLLFVGAAVAACEDGEPSSATDAPVDGGASDGSSSPTDSGTKDDPTSDAATGDADARTDAETPDADTPDSGDAGDGGDVAIPCTCAAGQGCLVLTVDRLASNTTMPWTVWPNEADGTGTLVVTAHTVAAPFTSLSQKTVANADLRAATASYDVDLGCLAAGTVDSFVFLDDNDNRQSGAVFNDEYRDTCGRPGPGPITIESQKTTKVTFTLKGSCD